MSEKGIFMLTVGICDDEQKMRKILRPVLERKLQLLGEEYRIAEYDSGEALLSCPDADRPDLLFLDIEMKELNGMDTARALRRRSADTILIFVTAYPDYVFQGYEVHAFHYLLKPYDERKIMDVLEQALRELSGRREQFFVLEQKSGTMRISHRDIVAFASDKRKVLVFLADGTTRDFYGKLDDTAAALPDCFVRIHNRYLVNLNHMTALEKDSCICGMQTFPVSRACRPALEIAFARMLLH